MSTNKHFNLKICLCYVSKCVFLNSCGKWVILAANHQSLDCSAPIYIVNDRIRQVFSIMRSTTIFKHNFGVAQRVSFTEYQGQRKLTLRRKYPTRKYICLSVEEVNRLLQLAHQVSLALLDFEQKIFYLTEGISLAVNRGKVDIRLRRLSCKQNDGVFVKRGIHMKHYQFEWLIFLLSKHVIYFI